MSTGYTAMIEEGCTFRRYLMGCARAFGACISMRDRPSTDEIPEVFSPDPYHQRQAIKAQAELAAIDALSLEDQLLEAAAMTESAHRARLKEKEEGMADAALIRQRYQSMREEVVAWKPPTDKHVGLRDFMLKQIDMCGGSDYWEQMVVEKVSPETWIKKRRADLVASIETHTRAYMEEVMRCAERSRWVFDLRASLPAP